MRGRRSLPVDALAALALISGGETAGQVRGSEPDGAVMIVTVRVTAAGTSAPLYRIDGVTTLRGNLPRGGSRLGANASGVAPSSASDRAGEPAAGPELIVRDRAGAVIHRQPFSYSEVITIPPVAPGEPDDGLPAMLALPEQSVPLIVPYLDAADRVEVRDVRDPGAVAVRVLTDEDRRLPGGRPALRAKPAVALPESFGILIVASGYLPAQMGQFQARAQQAASTILSAQPFAGQRPNLRISAYENTQDLGCAPGCGGIDRLMCCNSTAVVAAAASSGALYDEIVVIHNTPMYSGRGDRDYGSYKTNSYSTYCAAYDGTWTAVMALHEFGHSFGNLCDEYVLEPSDGHVGCVNCRASCDELPQAWACNVGCSGKPDYRRPEASIMLSLANPAFNGTSIESTLSPDGLRLRLSYFTGISTGAGAKGQFPPRDEVLAFRETLETYYRDTLTRRASPSYVDVEGEAVWIPEYLRYRLTACTHDGAVQRVMTQIVGYGVQPGCGSVSSDDAFPPRHETLRFRIELERAYRDDLRRSPGLTALDVEGSAVWLQEYLRYRLNGCPHGQASAKVILQIQGLGVQPLCS
jgi:hypothetical protein